MLVFYKPRYNFETLFKKFFADLIINYKKLKDSKIYFITPWISNIEFRPPLLIHPLSKVCSVLDGIKTLSKFGYKIFIITRCFDDRIIPQLIYTINILYSEIKKYINRGKEPPSGLCSLLKDMLRELEQAIDSVNTILELVRYNIKIRFDVRPEYCFGSNILVNLHTKLYICLLYTSPSPRDRG